MADALVDLLNSYGYQPVFLPRTGVSPPELYNFADHKLIRRGALARYVPDGIVFTPTSGKLGTIEAKVTSGKSLDLAVGFLQKALATLGIGSLPRVDLSFAGSNSFVFALTDVTYQTVDPAELDGIIQRLTVPLAIPDEYVASGALHIAYEYAYARTLTMRRGDGAQFAGDVSGGIDQFVDVGTKAKVDVQSRRTISFTAVDSDVPAFAYKAGRLRQLAGRWTFEPEVVMRTRAVDATAQRRPFLPAARVVLVADDTER